MTHRGDEAVLAGQGKVDTVSHAEGSTMSLPCREVFAHGQKAVRVWGPVAEVESEGAALHAGFWRAHGAAPA